MRPSNSPLRHLRTLALAILLPSLMVAVGPMGMGQSSPAASLHALLPRLEERVVEWEDASHQAYLLHYEKVIDATSPEEKDKWDRKWQAQQTAIQARYFDSVMQTQLTQADKFRQAILAKLGKKTLPKDAALAPLFKHLTQDAPATVTPENMRVALDYLTELSQRPLPAH